MKKYLITLLMLTVYSCGNSNDSTVTPVSVLPSFAEIGAGEYSIPCFLNKFASEGFGSDIYSKATLKLNGNGTGSNDFELFDDAACTNMLGSGTVIVKHYDTVLVGDTPVLEMVQDDGFSEMQLWIGYAQVSSSYYIDLDFSDGESGPYLTVPTTAELNEFTVSPDTEGKLLTKNPL